MAFCPNCGAKLPDGAQFCGYCGERVAVAQETQPAPEVNAQPAEPVYTEPVTVNPQPDLLGKAIAAAIFSMTPLAVVGFILALIGNGQIKKIDGVLTGKNKAAKIILKVALPVSIFCMVIYTISFIAGVIGGLSGQGFNFSYDLPFDIHF